MFEKEPLEIACGPINKMRTEKKYAVTEFIISTFQTV
jgi:hypothetical protein